MKFSILATFAALATATPDYFPIVLGGNWITSGSHLHRNNTGQTISPLAVPSPLNPSDHYYRLSAVPGLNVTNTTSHKFQVLPTQAGPGSFPVWFALATDNPENTYRLTTTTYEGGTISTDWRIEQSGTQNLLRYGAPDDTEYHWIAVATNATDGTEGWAPWWVARNLTGASAGYLNGMEYVAVDIELIVATGLINSSAPFGTN